MPVEACKAAINTDKILRALTEEHRVEKQKLKLLETAYNAAQNRVANLAHRIQLRRKVLMKRYEEQEIIKLRKKFGVNPSE